MGVSFVVGTTSQTATIVLTIKIRFTIGTLKEIVFDPQKIGFDNQKNVLLVGVHVRRCEVEHVAQSRCARDAGRGRPLHVQARSLGAA